MPPSGTGERATVQHPTEARLVARLVAPRRSARDRIWMDQVNRAVGRLTELVGNDVDALRPMPASIDVETLVRRVCGRLSDGNEAAEIRLVVVCGGGAMRGDGVALLEQTLFDLVGHAIEETAPGRPVHLETRVTEAGDQVWTMQGSSTELHREAMLLASVATSLGGALAFESRKGQGTTVRLWLPREGRQGGAPWWNARLGI